ncbi:hypothetical protein [Methanosarcina sp. MTP4]|uniref:hypothetical protein n=1 Tax=Methanosarcina sp. MTP4 TaxID=1434100 RepID=UPI0012E049F4|nr:hypothetical protein [Methanosarcina sp. MTP4]
MPENNPTYPEMPENNSKYPDTWRYPEIQKNIPSPKTLAGKPTNYKFKNTTLNYTKWKSKWKKQMEKNMEPTLVWKHKTSSLKI